VGGAVGDFRAPGNERLKGRSRDEDTASTIRTQRRWRLGALFPPESRITCRHQGVANASLFEKKKAFFPAALDYSSFSTLRAVKRYYTLASFLRPGKFTIGMSQTRCSRRRADTGVLETIALSPSRITARLQPSRCCERSAR
jgi:hypothetical protein